MNKAELVQAMADDAGLSKSDAEKALNALMKMAIIRLLTRQSHLQILILESTELLYILARAVTM